MWSSTYLLWQLLLLIGGTWVLQLKQVLLSAPANRQVANWHWSDQPNTAVNTFLVSVSPLLALTQRYVTSQILNTHTSRSHQVLVAKMITSISLYVGDMSHIPWYKSVISLIVSCYVIYTALGLVTWSCNTLHSLCQINDTVEPRLSDESGTETLSDKWNCWICE